MNHEVLGHLEFDHITLLVPDHPDLRVMIYSPDADTKTKLKMMLDLKVDTKNRECDNKPSKVEVSKDESEIRQRI